MEETLITNVFSDEDESPGRGRGNGRFSADAVMTEEGLALRSERDGNGDGRVYLIISQVTDVENNEHTSCSVVGVPHDKSEHSLLEVLTQAKSALTYCKIHGTAPSDFKAQGESEDLGPKQVVKTPTNYNETLDPELFSHYSTALANTNDTSDANTDNTTDVEADENSEEDQRSGGGGSTSLASIFALILLLLYRLRKNQFVSNKNQNDKAAIGKRFN